MRGIHPQPTQKHPVFDSSDLALLLSALLSLCSGSYETPIEELLRGIFCLSQDRKINLVVRNNRLPRICTAILAGSRLGLSGCILQVVLGNPLASSSTLGVSHGATFGAAFAIVVLGMNSTAGFGIPLCALLGSVAVALAILGLSRFRQISPEGIVLAGVAISSMFTGATTLIQYFADEAELSTLVFWIFGDLGSTGWKELPGMGMIVAVLYVYSTLHRWDYNALLSGEETAISLGIPVKQLILTSMLSQCGTDQLSQFPLVNR